MSGFLRLIGRRCPALAKMDLYRFIENAVKPRLVAHREDISGGLYGLHRLTSRAADIPYPACGIALSYTYYVEWHGSAQMEAARNLTKYTSIELK